MADVFPIRAACHLGSHRWCVGDEATVQYDDRESPLLETLLECEKCGGRMIERKDATGRSVRYDP